MLIYACGWRIDCILIGIHGWFVLFLFVLYFFSVQASVMSSTEATKSKTVILMEKEKIYLNLNQFATKVSFPGKSFLFSLCNFNLLHTYISIILPLKRRGPIFVGSYYGGYESYGYGEWSRGCANAWKRSSIWRITFAIYGGQLLIKIKI